MNTMPPLAVIGGGIMGRGIARVFADAGRDVHLHDVDDPALERAMETLRSDLDRAVARDALSTSQRDTLLGHLSVTTSLQEAVAGTDLVIEAVPEDLDLKRAIFDELSRLTGPDVVLATNTSALSVTGIASATPQPERVLGLHFFNPVHRMELVEVVVGVNTAPDTVRRAVAACRAAGKTTVEVADRPGFATSRINAMIGNEAFHMLMEGVASAHDIDIAMKLALNHPMGPFELVDLVGLDTRLSVLRRLHQALGDKFRPCPLLVNLVEAGRLGRKTGHGVFRYGEDGSRLE